MTLPTIFYRCIFHTSNELDILGRKICSWQSQSSTKSAQCSDFSNQTGQPSNDFNCDVIIKPRATVDCLSFTIEVLAFTKVSKDRP